VLGWALELRLIRSGLDPLFGGRPVWMEPAVVAALRTGPGIPICPIFVMSISTGMLLLIVKREFPCLKRHEHMHRK